MAKNGRTVAWLKYWMFDKIKVWRFNCGSFQTINYIEFSQDGKHFVTCSMEKSIKIWGYRDHALPKMTDTTRLGIDELLKPGKYKNKSLAND